MSVYSIICEYNPFHNGHKYQIDSLKPNTVVCLMSSNVVQRGSFAVCDKYSRARAAVECGADLVLEIPFPYSAMSAEYYATAGIEILTALGFAEYLSFGSECGQTESLEHIAEYLVSQKYEEDFKSIITCKPQLSYASARELAILQTLGEEYAQIIKQPNNILGVEYIKAIKKKNSHIIPVTLMRHCADYHDDMPTGNFASAGNIRKLIASKADIKSLVPPQAYDMYTSLAEQKKMPSDMKNIENGILAFLRMTPAEKLKDYYDCAPVADIIKKAAADSVTLEELYDKCSTKSYTRSRIRRCITCAYLGVEKSYAYESPAYTSVLALNSRGAELLAIARKNSGIAVITKPAHIKKYVGTEVYRQYMAGVTADDVFALTLPEPERAGWGLRRGPVVSQL
ncbi:MAG: nucleotidyltransferase family protein [Ruminococcaceae bacterium]|nr:nucleotidyltransferase family protein [Oscillospiraceae bacterium]